MVWPRIYNPITTLAISNAGLLGSIHNTVGYDWQGKFTFQMEDWFVNDSGGIWCAWERFLGLQPPPPHKKSY
jgi:hypothetical protein